MSFAFDTLSKAWLRLRAHLPEDVRHSDVAVRFEFLYESMHDANHRLGDAIAKDIAVTRTAQRLEDAMKKKEKL